MKTESGAKAGTEDLAALTASLTQRQAVLEAQINSKLDEVRDERVGFDSSNSTDGGDGAQIDAQGDVQQAEIERDLAEVRDISAALERIAAGNYGACIDCGVAIDPARLLAWPTARRCTACQGENERSRPKTASL
jgi:RNA polymerase-binding transcription factor DksA